MTSNHSGIADADYSNDETHHAIIDSHVALCPQVWSSGGIQCQICYLTCSNVSEINHHYDTSIDDVRKKLAYDLEYVARHRSSGTDFRIMAKTLPVMVFKKGAM